MDGVHSWLYPLDLFVCSGGLLLLQRPGARILAWDEIPFLRVESYWNFSIKEPVHSFHIRLKEGKNIAFNSILGGIWFNNAREVFDDILESRDNFLRQRATESLGRGINVDFGAVALGCDGLYHGAEFLAWGEIKMVMVRRSAISFFNRATKSIISVFKKGGVNPHWTIAQEQLTTPAVFFELCTRCP